MAWPVLPLLGVPPIGGTEGHRVMPARAMLATGDFLVPELVGEAYLRKPPGHFWLIAASQSLFGENAWAWRLPSALSAMALAACLAWFGRRWYGATGGWAAGVSCVALVAMWSQSRTADIDAANTLASVVAAMVLLELTVRRPTRRWLWGLLLAAAMGATLLLKLHGGLSLVGGALLAGAMVGGLRSIGRPSVWLGLMGGAGLFLAWAVPVALRVGEAGDTRGVAEASQNLLRADRLIGALRAQGELLLFAMPFTVGLLLTPRLLQKPDFAGVLSERRRITLVVLLTLGLGHALLLLNGVTNPRYGYVLLPMWAMLAAAVAAAWRDGRLSHPHRKLVEWTLAVTAVALPVTAVVLAGMIRRDPPTGFTAQPWLSAAFMLGPAAAIASLLAWGANRWALGTAGAVAGVLVLALPLVVMHTQQRVERSGQAAGRVMAGALPAGAVVVADALVRDKPEVFLYAEGVTGQSRGGLFDDPSAVALPAGTYIGLTQREWQRWQQADRTLPLDRLCQLPTRPDRPAVLAAVAERKAVTTPPGPPSPPAAP